MAFRYLTVYPVEGQDDPSTVVITKGTDWQELERQLCHEFHLPSTTNISLDYHDAASNRLIVVPLSAIRDFVLASLKEISVRIHVYPDENQNTLNRVDEHEESAVELATDSVDTGKSLAAEGGTWENEKYFGEYGKFIHWSMLTDVRRCEAYKQALETFVDDIKGKVVLDCGCGTGLLSILAAKAGAKKVYAIEASDMHEYATSMVAHNLMTDIVEVIHGLIENVELPVPQVDVIISEWMGVFLLFESMLDSVLFARDKWLKPGGRMFPSHAKMFLAPCRMDAYYKDRAGFFEKVHYGVDYIPLQFFAKIQFTQQPLKGYMDTKPEHVVGPAATFKEIDIETSTVSDIRSFSSEFETRVSPGNSRIHGIVTWWQVEFTGSANGTAAPPIVLSTSPFLPVTHWYWDVFLFDEPLEIADGEDNTLRGKIVVSQHKQYRRHYQITISCRGQKAAVYKEFTM